MPAADALLLQRLSDDAFVNAPLIRDTDWAKPDLWFVERDGDGIRGCIAVVWREIDADGAFVRVGGIANLVVAPAARGTGLAARLLDRAFDELRAMPGVVAGMLLCEPVLVSFYERLGWQRIGARLRCMQHGEDVEWRGAAMLRPIVPSALDGARIVRLNGLPW